MLVATTLMTFTTAQEKPAEKSPAQLLNEAIWWPGDFSQICRGDGSEGPFFSPSIPGYGTVIPEDYFLSADTIAKLREKRDEVVYEIESRLKSFDWRKPPKAPVVSADVLEIAKKQLAPWSPAKLKAAATAKPRMVDLSGGIKVPVPDVPPAGPGPWKRQNPMAFGSAMLRIIEALDAVEVLPELLRLEGELHAINEKTTDAAEQAALGNSISGVRRPPVPPSVFVPAIEISGSAVYEERGEEWSRLGRPEKSKWLEWKARVFNNLVFEREILGVCLGMLERKGYKPLDESRVGRLRKIGLRRDGLRTMDALSITGEEGLKANPKVSHLKWNAELRVPLSGDEVVPIPWSDGIRNEARWLIEAFILGKEFTVKTDVAKLLEDVIRMPGSWSQMCASPPPVPLDVPMPVETFLIRRHFNINPENDERLMACRNEVVPVLKTRLGELKLEPPPKRERTFGAVMPSKQTAEAYGPIIFQIVSVLNAIECLPELLAIEQKLAGIIERGGADKNAPVPELDLDSGTSRMIRFEAPVKEWERLRADYSCRIVQREILGLIKTLLIQEEHAPMQNSAFVAAQLREGRKQLEEQAANVKSEKDIPWRLEKLVVWNPKMHKAVPKDGAALHVTIPYTPEIRAEIRKIAEEFLRSVPPEKWKAGDAIHLPWFDKE